MTTKSNRSKTKPHKLTPLARTGNRTDTQNLRKPKPQEEELVPYFAEEDQDEDLDDDRDDDDHDRDDDEEEVDSEDDDDDGENDDDDGENDDQDEDSDENEYTASSYLAGHVIPLPSGKNVRVRPVSLISMIDQDLLPPNLLAAARRQLYGKDDRIARQTEIRMQKQNPNAKIAGDGELMDHMCCQMIASFSCVKKPQAKCRKGEVSVYLLFEADKLAILEFAMKGQRTVTKFRRAR